MKHPLFANILEILDEHRPAIQADGGDIELLRIEDDIVYVRLHGACIGCPLSFITLKMGLERIITAKYPQIKEIIALEEDEL